MNRCKLDWAKDVEKKYKLYLKNIIKTQYINIICVWYIHNTVILTPWTAHQ